MNIAASVFCRYNQWKWVALMNNTQGSEYRLWKFNLPNAGKCREAQWEINYFHLFRIFHWPGHTHMHTIAETQTQNYKRTHPQKHTPGTEIHTHTQKTHRHKHRYIHTDRHKNTDTKRTHTHTQWHIGTDTQTGTQTYTGTHAQIETKTHTARWARTNRHKHWQKHTQSLTLTHTSIQQRTRTLLTSSRGWAPYLTDSIPDTEDRHKVLA